MLVFLEIFFFLWKKERFYSAGYRAQDLSIAGRMLYHLSYGSSTKLFSRYLFTPTFLTESIYVYACCYYRQ